MGAVSGTRRKMTPEEAAEYGSDAGTRRKMTPEDEAAYRAANESHATGGGSPDTAERPMPPTGAGMKLGTAKDLAHGFANPLGGGPQLAGLMGAALQSGLRNQEVADALYEGRAVPTDLPAPLDAYRAVRDETGKQMEESDKTLLGRAGSIASDVALPVPVKALPRGAGALAHAKQGAKVGGVAGVVSGAARSEGDLTRFDSENWKRVIGDALKGGAFGSAGGGAVGGFLGSVKQPLRDAAETQALKAAGLRGGITNQVQRKLGLSTEQDARELGRKFLDEDLIPFGGSKEAVAKRAEALEGQAGNAIGAVLTKADTSGAKFDFDAFADAARQPILDPSKTTAVARTQAGKALGLADALEKQGVDTPGSFLGANRAKSDAWKSARFDDDAPVAAQLYRKAVGGARDDLERQVRAALGTNDAEALSTANRRYGVAQDALKLARNAGTRDQSNSTFGLREALLSSGGAGTGATLLGPEGAALGAIGGAVLANLSRKRGNAVAAHLADFLANRAANNSGGVVGAKGANALAPYLELLTDFGDDRAD